jgi:DNA-binding SARP family transcriptional activator/RecA/RadA recombinase
MALRLQLALLGCFEACWAPGKRLSLPKKTQALLAYLALSPGHAYAHDHLAGLLWGDTADERARKSLRQAMYVLRQSLPDTQPRTLLMDAETIGLNTAAVEVDVAVFERAVAEGTHEALERVAALYRGDLLAGLNVNEAAFEEWLGAERERLRELVLMALAKLLSQQSDVGQIERAIQTGMRLLALDPLQEAVHRTLMRLYDRQGRRGTALKQFQLCLASLQRELGTDPELETKRLYQDILQRRSRESSSVDERVRWQTSMAQRTPFDSRTNVIKREAPLIGRDAELVRLRELLDEALRLQGRVIAIAGEAGIGKSSLLLALAADAQARGTRTLLGRSFQTEQVLAFGPWVEALRSGHAVADADVLRRLTPQGRRELARLLPELGGGADEPTGSSPDQLRLFEATTELVCALAEKRPILLMLEDVHWADEMSARLLAFLGRRMRSARVMVVATLRDDELAGAPILGHVLDELSGESHFTLLMLTPLTRANTTALAQSMTTATLTEDVLRQLDEQIWRASEGNPFMVVETIRALQEGVVPQAPAALPLPERVRRVVAGRLERLSTGSRQLVSVAAVIGREFDFALLQRAAALGEREAAQGLEELVRRRVLHSLGERFDFTHERICEVAYEGLLQPHRKLLHVAVAKALEELDAGHGELQHATLAGHYRAGEVWDRALAHFRLAGTRAMRLSAYGEAVACFDQALEALRRLPQTTQTLEVAIDIRFDLRNALLPLGQFDSIRRRLQEADGLARTLSDQRRLGWLSVYMSHFCRTAGQFQEARGFAETGQDLGEVLGDAGLTLGAGLDLGAACISLGEYRRAADLFRRIVQSLANQPSRPSSGHVGSHAVLARTFLTRALAELGDFEEGIDCGEESIRLAEALEDPMSLAYACLRLGRLRAAKGDLDHAARLLERGLKLTQDWNIPVTEPVVAADLGHVYAGLGRVDDGLALLRNAVSGYESVKLGVGKTRLLLHLGDACLLAGQFEDARIRADGALARACACGQRGYEAYARRLVAEIAMRRGPDLEAAQASYDESATLARDLGMRPLLAHCHRGLGSLYHALGQTHAAQEHLAEAIALFRQMDMAPWREPALAS